jgi:hypothetical protein
MYKHEMPRNIKYNKTQNPTKGLIHSSKVSTTRVRLNFVKAQEASITNLISIFRSLRNSRTLARVTLESPAMVGASQMPLCTNATLRKGR